MSLSYLLCLWVSVSRGCLEVAAGSTLAWKRHEALVLREQLYESSQANGFLVKNTYIIRTARDDVRTFIVFPPNKES